MSTPNFEPGAGDGILGPKYQAVGRFHLSSGLTLLPADLCIRRGYIVAMRLGEIVKGSCIGFLLVAYLVLGGPSWHSLRDPCLTLLLVVVLWIPSALAHEFGHALAGRTLGFKLNYIRVGTGGAFSLGPRVQIGSNPFLTGGFTAFQPSSRPITRIGTVFLYSAGPLVNLALAFSAVFVIPISSSVGWGVLIINFGVFIDSLIPTRSRRIPGGWNDGAKVWKAILGRR